MYNTVYKIRGRESLNDFIFQSLNDFFLKKKFWNQMWSYIINIYLSELLCTKTKSLELINIKMF